MDISDVLGFDETESRSTTLTNRRSVLRGIGALGLTSSFAGLGSASGPSEGNGKNNEIDIGTQFWTYNNSGLPVDELIRESAAAGYDMVEPYTGFDDADAITTALEETDVYMGSAHVGVGQLENNDDLIQRFVDWDVDHLVHAYQGRDTFSDESALEEFAGRINDMADRLAEEGIQYGYHNHNHEFEETIGDTVAYDVFAENLNDNANLQLDVGWALVGGSNPVAVLNQHSDKIMSLHMKDMTRDGEFTEIGEGEVNMKAIANVARGAADLDFLIYEYDWAPNPLESMQTGAEFLETWNGPHDRSDN